MKIGVLSDIHLRRDNGVLRDIIDRYLNDVDMFFLCGDFTSMEIYEMFSYKEAAAVAGNMDDEVVKGTLPFKRVVEINNFRFGLIHGWGAPIQMEKRISNEFEDVDCIVFGHTHCAENKQIGNTMFFNPGSPTDKRFAPFNSIGILNVTQNEIKGEIVRI
jgi:putative phosphoesterase